MYNNIFEFPRIREPQWSSDEKLVAVLVNNRVQIYEDAKFDRYTQHIQAEKLKSFSISPSPAPNYYFSVFTLGMYLLLLISLQLVNVCILQAHKCLVSLNM